jgi:hypothetical protein
MGAVKCFVRSGVRVFRLLRFAVGGASFELAGGVVDQVGDLTKETRGALFGSGRHFLFDVAAQARDLLVQPRPNLFKFVHVRPRESRLFLASQAISPTWVL